jgi:hypothetical protein
MNSMQQRHDLCILWNLKSVQDHISAKERKEDASVRMVAPFKFFTYNSIHRKYAIFSCPLTNQNGTPPQPQENECSLIIRDKDAGLLTFYMFCSNLSRSRFRKRTKLRIPIFCKMTVPKRVIVSWRFGGTYCLYLQRSVRMEAASYSEPTKVSVMLLRNLTTRITRGYDDVLHYYAFKEHNFRPWCTLKEESLPFCRQFIQNCSYHINATQFDVYCVTSSCTYYHAI